VPRLDQLCYKNSLFQELNLFERIDHAQARAFSHFVSVYQELNACFTCEFYLYIRGYSFAERASSEAETAIKHGLNLFIEGV